MSYPQPPYAQQQYAPAPPAPRNGFGIAALCLAIGGLVFGIVPFTGFIAIILGALALLFGLLGTGRVAKGLATNRKMSIIGSVLGVCALALGVWGVVIVFKAVDDLAGPDVSSVQGAGQAPATPLESADSTSTTSTAAFGDTYTWESGVAVTVSTPTAYKPSSYAAGNDRGRVVQMDVTVTNGSDAPLELVTVTVQASFAGEPSSMVFDSAKKLNGPPATSVLPGKTSKFKVAFSVDKTPGELQVEVRPGFIGQQAYFVGQV